MIKKIFLRALPFIGKGDPARLSSHQKGFTLIELLVVIAIIAILSIVVILTLNPAEILRQARDSNRISDLNTLKSGISLFLADVSTTTTGGGGTQTPFSNTNALGNGFCYINGVPGSVSSTCAWNTTLASQAGAYINRIASSTSKTVNGSGWIPVNFSAISSGAPFGNLPSDPTNNLFFFYAYVNSTGTTSGFKLGAHLESTKYGASGTSDVVSTDGGTDNFSYETGTQLQGL